MSRKVIKGGVRHGMQSLADVEMLWVITTGTGTGANIDTEPAKEQPPIEPKEESPEERPKRLRDEQLRRAFE